MFPQLLYEASSPFCRQKIGWSVEDSSTEEDGGEVNKRALESFPDFTTAALSK